LTRQRSSADEEMLTRVREFTAQLEGRA
jgi:hypothetical protein